ncbi:hypothetical protein [Streptomyces sp. NPDC002566]|uniref:hypothetical protein n=1 Tax=Streptomyces sp. NPDC002566 TaxID=3364650 RepID=UPI0036A6778A
MPYEDGGRAGVNGEPRTPRRTSRRTPQRTVSALAALALALLLASLLPPARAGAAAAAGQPTVRLSLPQAGAGGSLTVTGGGWRPHALLTLLICGQATPARGVLGGTNSCANADGRAVTTDADGRFSRALPVSAPPAPCPCVVHVATTTGAKAQADAALQVAGHPVRPLPAETGKGRLTVLTDPLLKGSDGLLTWFGAPPDRTLTFTVGNAGVGTVKDPVFEIGTAHGVFAPQWDERQWRGTVAPGGKARVEIPVELAAGAHGDYTVSLRYGGKVLDEQPWSVGRPWGVTVFWVLLCLVVPAAVFRVGMAVVNRVRPRPGSVRRSASTAVLRRRRTAGTGDGGPRSPAAPPARPPGRLGAGFPRPLWRDGAPTAEQPSVRAPALPWFTPDAGPGAAGGLPAPHDDDHPTSPTTPGRKGPP